MGISQNIFGNHSSTRKRSLNVNASQLSHQVFQEHYGKRTDNVTENKTESNQHLSLHHLNKRDVLNATMDNKDSYVIVPSARKKNLHNNGDNRRISVMVHNITSLISDDSRMVDDVGDSITSNHR